MPRYIVTLTDDKIGELKRLIQKGGKGYRIKHAQILLKLDERPENTDWTYDQIKDAYRASHSTIPGYRNDMCCKAWTRHWDEKCRRTTAAR